MIEPDGTWLGIFHDPGLVFGAARAGEVLHLTDFVMFPVDQTKDPLAFTLTADRLRHLEPEFDLTSWNVSGLSDGRSIFLSMRVDTGPSIKEGDRVMAVGYPKIRTSRRPGAQMVSYQEEMRGSIGRVIKVDHEWNHDRKIWPTIVVDVQWKSGMSGGPVFNEDGHVVGIVSRGADGWSDAPAWSRALWLEVLPYRLDIYGSIDPARPGWIRGWGVCNPKSVIELFQTQDAAEAYAQKAGSGLSVRQVSMPHPGRFSRPEDTRRHRSRA